MYTLSMPRIRIISVALISMLSGSVSHAAALDSLGKAGFQNSCQPVVQSDFERAVALLHSFEFGEALQGFKRVESADSTCVIAAWGVALANTQRSGPDIAAAQLASGWKELEPWLSRPAKTDREQMYMTAVSKMYDNFEKTSGDERWQQYIAAMQAIRLKYPDDINASLFYALAMVSMAGSGPTGLERRRAALDILLPILASHPDNPGAAHYIIHAADTPELAAIALPAARVYATIAPDSPHALHMPSHIFNRLGYWQEAISSNIASARVAADWVKEGRDGLGDEFHALNNLEYGYLQLGEDAKARAVIDQIANIATAPGGDPWLPIDARIYYDLETHDWQGAIKTQPPPASPFIENFDTYWIHSIAAARLNNPQEAATELEEFRKSSGEWSKSHGWEDILHIALMQAEAWTLFGQGKQQEAVETLNGAVQYERGHPIYYADVLPRPSSEMLGDMLSKMGQPVQALGAYRVALEMAPNTLDSLKGAQAAAAKSGQAKLAQEYEKKIASLGGSTIALRP
jgi:tetratricopeptide (TPR) repeat protein